MSQLDQNHIDNLERLAAYRREVLFLRPPLKMLFFELTTDCNEKCLHCGSKCNEIKHRDQKDLSFAEYKALLEQVASDFDITQMMLCITGGEPMMSPFFFDVVGYAHELGYRWGMTTNGTLINEDAADRLVRTGMRTVSVSLDGLEQTHDQFRQRNGSYRRTLEGIAALVKQGKQIDHVQVTTVVHRRNIKELAALYEVVDALGVKSWRITNIDPIGRALDHQDLLLTNSELKEMLEFIKERRGTGRLDVTYGCAHYLGKAYERTVRKWYFLCNAGIYVASVTCKGDLVACLDIPRRPELIQGNVRKDRLSDVWRDGYRMFRSDDRKQGKCADCQDYEYCVGDSFHTWDFDRKEPMLCMKEVLEGT